MLCVIILMLVLSYLYIFFFFNDTATTEIYTLSLHDALPISFRQAGGGGGAGLALVVLLVVAGLASYVGLLLVRPLRRDRKSTRLNSSHGYISYAVFCLKKKKNKRKNEIVRNSLHTRIPMRSDM